MGDAADRRRSGVKPAPFEYHRPATAEEAVTLLAELGDGAKILAGGQSLIAVLALRLAVFDHLVDISRIAELQGIERRDGALWVGAGTTEAEVERSADVASAAPLLAKATPFVGHIQIRNRGTVGGSIAHADPAAEYPAVALALDATAHVLSPRGPRTIEARDLFDGIWSTTIADDELLVGVSFPQWQARSGFAVREVARRHGDFAIAGAAVGVELDEADRITRCAIGLLGMGSTPERASRAEDQVRGRGIDEVDVAELGTLAVEDLAAVPDDLHGSARYRRKVCAVMAARAWASACEEAKRG
jgi:carbon-monoxide dehydrogenase medium subunit